MDGFNPIQAGVHRFLLGCAKTVCSRLMKLSDCKYNYIGHHLKWFSVYSNLGCCHGNTFVKSGSLVKMIKISQRS